MCRALKQLCLVQVELQRTFICKTGCEIVELGPKFETIHKIDEKIEKLELERLTDIYHQILLNLNEETNS